MFVGADPSEADDISLTGMEAAESWILTPALTEIQEIAEAVGKENVIIGIDFTQPFVIDEESGVRDFGAIFALWGVSDRALLDIVTGESAPSGKLPFALPSSVEAVLELARDLPGYSEEGTLYPFGYGLTY